MKVNLKQNLSRWKAGFIHAFLSIFLMGTMACDFDIPDKFEIPTWYIDLKIPLVQTRYEMSDISDSSAGIFLTDDSLGFKIVQEGSMDPTALPDLPSVPMGLDQSVSSGEIPGISIAMDLPSITISQRIDVVAYNSLVYFDTASYDSMVIVEIPYNDPETTFVTLSNFTPFSFPTDSILTMPVEDQYDSVTTQTIPGYNTLIVGLFNTIMDSLSEVLNTTIDLGLSSIELPDDPPLIASIDTLIIKTSEDSSVYITRFKNKGLPTNLINVRSYIVTGNGSPLNDTLASHNQSPTISQDKTYADTTNLSAKGLTSFINMATSMTLASATDDFVTIPPGSLYVDFNILFQMAGIDSIDVTTNNYSLSDGIEMPDMSIPEMDMSASGISKMEIYRAVLKGNDALFNENKLIISDLQSTLPFDLNFLMNFKNFSPDPGGDSVKIDTLLTTGLEINKTFDMRSYSLQSPGYPDSAMGSFDLDLDVSIPSQYATIPLDGSPLGEFTMNMNLDQLSFSSLEANLYMIMESDSTSQEFPPGFTGAIPTEALIEIIFKNQIRLPLEMNMEFKAYNSLGELTYMPVIIDTIGFPATNADTDTAMTIIGLNKLGTTITIYESVNDSLPSYQNTVAPCDTCASIIDLLASNPVQLIIKPEVKVDGRGEIAAGKAIQGGFRVTIPFVLQLEPMTFMGGTPTEITEFDHEARSKIRNSLIQTDLVSTITNAMPFGAEISVLMSNDSLFPTDTTVEQLGLFRDTLAAIGVLSPSDSLYILNKCSDISPDSGEVYIFNVMTDFSECIEKLPYIVKYNGSGTDTIISYVDTLFKFILPDPIEYYGANDTSGYPEGMVAVPGEGIYTSTIDTSQIFLLTDYGSHYTMPRFHLPGTGSVGVFISVEDYLEISSFITFRLSSSGAFASVENELVITYPNGGETLYLDQAYEILWKTFGTSEESVDLYYAISGNAEIYKPANCVIANEWTEIESGIENVGSYEWDLSSSGLDETDSLRIKIISSDGKSCDINGYFLKVRNSARSGLGNPFTGRSKLNGIGK